ncbi:MAG: hypothetical protein ACRDI2_16360 [Chloroflexota bacterium]
MLGAQAAPPPTATPTVPPPPLAPVTLPVLQPEVVPEAPLEMPVEEVAGVEAQQVATPTRVPRPTPVVRALLPRTGGRGGPVADFGPWALVLAAIAAAGRALAQVAARRH